MKVISAKEMMKSPLNRCFPKCHVVEEPRHIEEAQSRLETLKEVKKRHFGNAPLLLVTAICPFRRRNGDVWKPFADAKPSAGRECASQKALDRSDQTRAKKARQD
ncbi:hypothetical protein Aduo_019980 [Ancylostoma duodenale]